MAAASAQFVAPDGGAAHPAWLAASPVDPRGVAVIAVGAGEIAKVAEGCSTRADAGFKHLHQGVVETLELRRIQLAAWGMGRDSAGEQRFIRVDVPDTGHQRLIQQCGFDRSARARQLGR